MTSKMRNCDCCNHLLLGWTPSPAYPGRLGASSSVLIPALSITSCKVVSELSGWVESLRKLDLAHRAKIMPLTQQASKQTAACLTRRTPNHKREVACNYIEGLSARMCIYCCCWRMIGLDNNNMKDWQLGCRWWNKTWEIRQYNE